LAISQRLLGTEEIILVHHTDCGMLTFTDDQFKKQIQTKTGIKPPWAVEAFGDLDEDVRQSIARIKASPFIPKKHSVRGFVYDVFEREGCVKSSRLRLVGIWQARASSRPGRTRRGRFQDWITRE